ncbi:ATP-binding protein [Polluticaenibacter yanchengensis]|uniref:Oxygen sensor histidine kinase NreB n=1 Tax=Polluticaenibacter yanchengensis TaxID=3014562 RepID=A0ABT4UEU0_9BACT|nr:histidine kinase [Chitinophagaceae bacterium LY-5]
MKYILSERLTCNTRIFFLFLFTLYNSVTAFSQVERKTLSTSVYHTPQEIDRAFKEVVKLRESHTDSAIGIYHQLWENAQKIEYKTGIGKALQGLARCYSNKNDLDIAIKYCHESMKYADSSLAGRDLAVGTWLIYSDAYYFKGRYDSCAWYRYEALNEIENGKITKPDVKMKVYGSILQFWLNVHQDVSKDIFITETMQKIDAIEKEALKNKDSAVLSNVYFYKAGYYNNIKQRDSARYFCHLNIALNTVKLSHAPSVVVATWLNLSTTYLEDNQPQQALEYIAKAEERINQSMQFNNRFSIIAAFFKGDALLKLHRYQEAIRAIEPALVRAEASKITRLTELAHKSLADAYTALNQPLKASFHNRRYADLKDSLMESEKMEIIYNIEMRNRIADREKQIIAGQQTIENNRQSIRNKNILISAISSILFLVTLVGLLLYRNKSQKAKLQKEQLSAIQKQMQINQLQAMIDGEEKERNRIAKDLHDGVGGTIASARTQLSAIYRKYQQDNVEADFKNMLDVLESASIEIRQTAHNLMPDVLFNNGLPQAVEDFCNRIARGQRFNMHVEIVGTPFDLPQQLQLSVYRIIQELVHNILKHAHASEVLVQLAYHLPSLHITVEDDGVGLPPHLSKETGIGLKTIQQRVDALQGSIIFESKPGKGTSIEIEFKI